EVDLGRGRGQRGQRGGREGDEGERAAPAARFSAPHFTSNRAVRSAVELPPAQSWNSPGSTTWRPASSWKPRLDVGSTKVTVLSSPAARRTFSKPFSSRSGRERLATRSRT